VTAVQPVHLSRIGSIEAIEAAKGELLEALPAAGTAILNADDPIVRRMAARTAARPLTYGFADDADVGAEAVTSAGTDGMRFTLRAGGERRPATTPSLGRLSVHNGLAAAAVGIAAGVALDAIVEGIAAGWSAPHRMTLVRLADVTVIDDSYNASPGSVAAALEVLADLPGRPVAVLGEMLELGPDAAQAHRRVGAYARAAGIDVLVTVGAPAVGLADGFGGEAIVTAGRDEALLWLRENVSAADVVLVKASRGAALEVVVEGLLAPDPGGTEGSTA
jgi:UDP-N-acetylmuramoyl-tripeptide--D-alanyl-D-alanine ligase